MNSGTNDVTCNRAYLPDALRLMFADNLSIRAIAQHLSLSHSTVHALFQRLTITRNALFYPARPDAVY